MKLLKFFKTNTKLTLTLITKLAQNILTNVLCIIHNEIYKYIFVLFLIYARDFFGLFLVQFKNVNKWRVSKFAI